MTGYKMVDKETASIEEMKGQRQWHEHCVEILTNWIKEREKALQEEVHKDREVQE